MRAAFFVGMLCAVLLSSGCEWAITPDEGIADLPGFDNERQLSLVDMGPAGPSCTVDQGDERPMVQGRLYVLVYTYGDDRHRAYELRNALVNMGLDVVVGHQVKHRMFFVRSRRGYDRDLPDDLDLLREQIKLMTAAITELYREDPSLLHTPVSNTAPYAFDASRP